MRTHHRAAALAAAFMFSVWLGVSPSTSPKKPASGQTKPTAQKKNGQSPSPTADSGSGKLGVVLFPVTGTSSKSKDEQSRAGAQEQKLSDAISAIPLYHACILSTGKMDCSVRDAAIFVYGSYGGGKVSYDSLDVAARRRIDGIAFASLDATPSDQDARKLLGRIGIKDDKLVVLSGFQQYVQLVPVQETSTDPDYALLVQHMLARRGVSALRSNLTLGTLNSSSDGTICANGEQYLVYYVTLQSDAKVLLGHTRVSANANGFIADCNRHITFPFAAEDKRSIPTTKNSLAQYGSILAGTLFPKFSWTPINTSAGTIASFIDVDPTSVNVRNNVAELALQRMIDNLCRTSDTVYASPVPTPTAIPTPTPTPSSRNLTVVTHTTSAGPTKAQNAPAASGAATAGAPATLDLASFTGPEPFFVHCNDAATNALHVEPTSGNAYTGLFDRWKTPPAPTPTP